MPDYRRAWHPGGTWFFTVIALQRRGNDLLIRPIGPLRNVVRDVRRRHRFAIHAWVARGVYSLDWAGSDLADVLGEME